MRKEIAEDFHLTASFMSVRVRLDEHRKTKSCGSLPWVTRILKAHVSRCLPHETFHGSFHSMSAKTFEGLGLAIRSIFMCCELMYCVAW